jgi:type III restriction enzyme
MIANHGHSQYLINKEENTRLSILISYWLILEGKETVVDLLDPHQIDLADAPAKAAGLAEYAAKHGHMFGRIELIIIEEDKIKRLNLNDEETSNKVKQVATNEHLQQLYDSTE